MAPPILLGLSAYGNLETALVFAGCIGLTTAAVLFATPSQGARVSRFSAPAAAAAAGSGGIRSILSPTVLGLTAFFTLVSLTNSAINSFSVVALMATQAVTFTAANVALTAFLAGSALGVLAGGALADKTSRHGIVAAIGFGLAALVMLLAATLSLSLPLLVLAMGLSGVIFGIMQPSRDMLVRRAAPPGAIGPRVRHRLDRIQHRRHHRPAGVRLDDGPRLAPVGVWVAWWSS